MRFNHLLAGFAGAAALFGTTIACAENPERDPTWDRQVLDASHAVPGERADGNRTAAIHADRASMQPHPFIHGFRKLAPEEETWDPAIDMDPRIGRYQDPNAPN